MTPTTLPSPPEDFSHFFDSLHGRVPFAELPEEFLPSLRAALNSPILDRLTRISQLGYTSLTFFSATQTRFSHSVGTMLTMNKLTTHLWGRKAHASVPAKILAATKRAFPDSDRIGGEASTSLRCHLLLAALLQDLGELPFQKVTSLYFSPTEKATAELESQPQLIAAKPRSWRKGKDKFTILSVIELFKEPDFHQFDLSFLTFLITGEPPQTASEVVALRTMVDGAIDADRLDYVFRDAQLTIGSITDSDRVIRSILYYEGSTVVVKDPQPAVDFFATRARLWTFVYASPTVRFRQALLKAFLSACFAVERGIEMLKDAGMPRELSFQAFLNMDEHSFLTALRSMARNPRLGDIAAYGREARSIMVKIVTQYDCRVLGRERPAASAAPIAPIPIQPSVFFDLLADHDDEHKLYTAGSVQVRQCILDKLTQPVPLERTAGAFASLFHKDTSVPLVRESFFLFLPETRSAITYKEITSAMDADLPRLVRSLEEEDIRRELVVADDTWVHAGSRKRIAISCCFRDRLKIIRVVRELARQKEPYRVLLDSLIGLGNTAPQNSRDLIKDADAVFVLMSSIYLKRWLDEPGSNIAIEVEEIRKKPRQRKVVFPLEPYTLLDGKVGARWNELDSSYTTAPIMVADELQSGDERLRKFVEAACTFVNT